MPISLKDSIDGWVDDLEVLFKSIGEVAEGDGWHAAWQTEQITETVAGSGIPLSYLAPILTISVDRFGQINRVTFEPKHRFTLGFSGRVDVYSYPAVRDAVLLRKVDTAGAEHLTLDEAEARARKGAWRLYSDSGLDLNVDLSKGAQLLGFLNDMIGPAAGRQAS